MSHYLLSFRLYKDGGPVTSGSLYLPVGDEDSKWDHQLADITSKTRGNRVLVLLHGYNTNYADGRLQLIRYMEMLEGFTGIMLATLWPGDGWAKALTYPFEGCDADDTGDALFKWITTHVDNSARISFVAHSLGSRVAMRTANQLALRRRPVLDRICLMAPAIDSDSLGRVCHNRGRADKTCYRDATLIADRIAVLASEEDLVLRFAYPLGDLTQTVLYGERWGSALGRTGPVEKDPAVTVRIESVPKSKSSCSIGHSDYLEVDSTGQTIAKSEKFVVDFLDKVPKPVWPPTQDSHCDKPLVDNVPNENPM